MSEEADRQLAEAAKNDTAEDALRALLAALQAPGSVAAYMDGGTPAPALGASLLAAMERAGAFLGDLQGHEIDDAGAGRFLDALFPPEEKPADPKPTVPNLIVFVVHRSVPWIVYSHGDAIADWGEDVGYETTANELADALDEVVDGVYVWQGEVRYWTTPGTPDSPPETDSELRGTSRPITDEEWEALSVNDPLWHVAELQAEERWNGTEAKREVAERGDVLLQLLRSATKAQLLRDISLCPDLSGRNEVVMKAAFKARDLSHDVVALSPQHVFALLGGSR